MPGQNDPSGKWHSQPLMRIEGDGIRGFDTLHEATVATRQKHSCPVGAIHVEPKIMAATHFGNRENVVDRSGTCCARGGDNAEGPIAAGKICADSGFKFPDIQLQAIVDRNAPQARSSNSQQSSRLVEGVVCLRGCIEYRLSTNASQTVLDHMGKPSSHRHG